MEFRTMRATRLSVANYNTTLSSDSLETGTASSNSLRSAKLSSIFDILWRDERNPRACGTLRVHLFGAPHRRALGEEKDEWWKRADVAYSKIPEYRARAAR